MKTKKIVSLFLSVLMLLSVFPFAAFATEIVKAVETTGHGAVVDSGYCGSAYYTQDRESLLYNLYEDGTLVVSPNPDDSAFRNVAESFFENYSLKNEIRALIMEEGVQGICDRAFVGCENLTSIYLPQSMRDIGDFVFVDCDNIDYDQVVFGDNIRYIGCYIFGSTITDENGNSTGYKPTVSPDYIGNYMVKSSYLGSDIKDGTVLIAADIIGQMIEKSYILVENPTYEGEQVGYKKVAEYLSIPSSVKYICNSSYPSPGSQSTVTTSSGSTYSYYPQYKTILYQGSKTEFDNIRWTLAVSGINTISVSVSSITEWDVFSDYLRIEYNSDIFGTVFAQAAADYTWLYNQKSKTFSLLKETNESFPYSETVDEEVVSYIMDSSYSYPVDRLFFGKGIDKTDLAGFADLSRFGQITLAPDNTDLKLVDGVLYDTAGETLIWCSKDTLNSEVFVVPDGVKEIMQNAFNLNRFAELTVPASLETIGAYHIANVYVPNIIYQVSNLDRLTILNDELDLSGDPFCVTGFTTSLTKEEFWGKLNNYSKLWSLVIIFNVVNEGDGSLTYIDAYDRLSGLSEEELLRTFGGTPATEDDILNAIYELTGAEYESLEAIFSDEAAFEQLMNELQTENTSVLIEDENAAFPWLVIHGHGGATSEAYANRIGAQFVCMHEFVDGVCKYCGYSETAAHTLVKTEAVAADCDNDGNSEYYTCTDCGKFFSDAQGENEIEEGSWIIPAGHGYDLGFDEEEVASTCSVNGYYRKICLDCGEIVENNVKPLDPNNHKGETGISNARERSCTVDGYTGDLVCLSCRNVIKSGTVNPAEHGYDLGFDEEEVASTCSVNGYYRKICLDCGDIVESSTKPLDPDNHKGETEIRNAREATCTVDGYTGDLYCKACDNKISGGETIYAQGHKWNAGEITVPATCRDKGVKTFTCTVCPETKTEDVPANPDNHFGGVYVTGKKDATCKEQGYTGDTYCKGCDKQLEKGTSTPLAAHRLDKTAAKSAGCEQSGNSEYYSCPVCGKYFSDSQGKNEIAKNSWIVPALGHSFGAWTVTKEPSYLHEGQKQRKCSRCAKQETAVIAKLTPDDSKTDLGTGSQIAYQNDVVPDNTKINVDEEFDGVYFQLLNREKGNVRKQLFNITLVSGGQKVQPNGYVLVRLPIPEGFNPAYMNVYYIASDGSGMEKLESYIDGGYICFETTHFSEYAIVDESPNQTPSETPETESNCVCGQYHTGPFAWLVKFLHRITYFFKNLFNKAK